MGFRTGAGRFDRHRAVLINVEIVFKAAVVEHTGCIGQDACSLGPHRRRGGAYSRQYLRWTGLGVSSRKGTPTNADTHHHLNSGFWPRWRVLRPYPLGPERRSRHRSGDNIVDSPHRLHAWLVPLTIRHRRCIKVEARLSLTKRPSAALISRRLASANSPVP